MRYDFEDDKELEKNKMRELVKNPLFRSANKALCEAFEAQEEEERMVEDIREYLRENPGASFVSVLTKLNVKMNVLERLIEEGRIEMSINKFDKDYIASTKQELFKELNKVNSTLNENAQKEILMAAEEAKKHIVKMYSKKDR